MAVFEPIELGQPERPKCPDVYNDASTRLTPGARRIVLQISKNAVYVQLGIMPHGRGASVGSVVWQDEEPWLVSAALGRRFDAVRIRNYSKGNEAQVFVNFA